MGNKTETKTISAVIDAAFDETIEGIRWARHMSRADVLRAALEDWVNAQIESDQPLNAQIESDQEDLLF